ncbi:MAG: PIG-L family deacetylase [Actinobacteria bacterium]|jgi:LmbE family N-acetylglucosaminyl deacetylase|nr:PIG-L family deacetylase [Actinomycetota bacterium]
MASSELPSFQRLLAVFAHPDDESFGFGAVVSALVDRGAHIGALCFTHGEASSLGDPTGATLGEIRATELASAAGVLGIDHPRLLDYPDGHLNEVPLDELAGAVRLAGKDAEAFIVFDRDGITGHGDHCRATEASLVVASEFGLRVLAWTLPESVAGRLNAEFGTCFIGRPPGMIDFFITVDRTRQMRAIACHASQSGDNPVLWRRLELLGNREHLCWLA